MKGKGKKKENSLKLKKRFFQRQKIYDYPIYKEKIMNDYLNVNEIDFSNKQTFLNSIEVFSKNAYSFYKF